MSCNIVYLLEPYYNNITKRAVKTPKIYFLDTGLVSYLTKWADKEVGKIGEGGFICMYDKIINLDEKNKVIPYSYL